MMSKSQKILATSLWAALVLVMLAVVAMWTARLRGQPSVDLPVLYDVPAFSLIDQQERAVTHQTLRGGPWVAAFIFTRCAGPCPLMTQQMARLQETVDDPAVKLVSFSVDPEYDTPEVLRGYAREFGADERRWHFLTGTDAESMHRLAAGMRLTAMPGQREEDDLFIHSTQFVLVDGEGRVRGVYSGRESEALRTLSKDVSALAALLRRGDAGRAEAGQ